MSTRDELAENLTAYIDGELSELEAKRMEEALRLDPELAALERQLRSTVDAVEAMPAPEQSEALRGQGRRPQAETAPSRDLRRAVLNRLDEKTRLERLRALFTLPRLVPAVGLAAAAAVAVVVIRDSQKPPLDAETLFVAQNMEVLEDMDVIGLENPDDLDVVANLHELEATP